METKQLTCPNCGANITNTQNCEYCGSLLIRFVDNGIDLSQTTYLNDIETYPGLIKALKHNLQFQKNTEEAVRTDILGPADENIDTGRNFIAHCVRNGYDYFGDESLAPYNSKNGISVHFSYPFYLDKNLDNVYERFNTIIEDKLKRFKTLDCYPLFTEHISFFTDNYGFKRKDYEYFIDFGKDAEGAARIISKVWKEVDKIPFDANIEYYTNAGDENCCKAIEYLIAERDGTEVNTDDVSFPDWLAYVIGAIIGLIAAICLL